MLDHKQENEELVALMRQIRNVNKKYLLKVLASVRPWIVDTTSGCLKIESKFLLEFIDSAVNGLITLVTM